MAKGIVLTGKMEQYYQWLVMILTLVVLAAASPITGGIMTGVGLGIFTQLVQIFADIGIVLLVLKLLNIFK